MGFFQALYEALNGVTLNTQPRVIPPLFPERADIPPLFPDDEPIPDPDLKSSRPTEPQEAT